MKIIRILSLLLTLLLLCGCVFDGGNQETSDTVNNDTESETEEPVEYIELVVDGKAQFLIVSMGEEYAQAADSLKTILQGKTGVSFSSMNFDPSPDEDGKIYVGCDWCEVTGNSESPKYGYYGVVWANGNLYVCGSTATEITQCVSVFASSITKDHISKDGEKGVQVAIPSTLMFLTEPEGTKVGTLLGYPLKEYRIVRSATASDVEQYFVGLLQAQLRQIGYDLNVVTDAEAPTQHEIVVGNTTRSGSTDFYGKTRGAGEYSIVGKGASLYIGYGSVLCLDEVLSSMSKVYYKETVNVTGSAEDTYGLEKSNSSDIRVMTSNVEYVAWDTKKKDYELRMRMTAEYYNLYLPDFIGLQEACAEMRAALTPYLDERYEYVDFSRYTSETVKLEYLPILYNADEWKVLDAGAGDWTHKMLCAWGYGWVKFGRIGNESETFYLLNLHYMPSSFVEQNGELYRYGIATEVNKKVKEIIAADPSAMIAITGDYNTDYGSDVFELMYENGRLETSYLLTKDTNLTPVQQAKWIDHISVTKSNVSVITHRSIDGVGTDYMSDHTPCFSDLRRKS